MIMNPKSTVEQEVYLCIIEVVVVVLGPIHTAQNENSVSYSRIQIITF